MLFRSVLHDILEDTEVTSIGVNYLFGNEVSTIVLELTCNSATNSDDKKIALLNQVAAGSIEAQTIKLADIISNVSSLPSLWSLDRKLSYIDWCKKVAKVCSSSSERLYDYFNVKVQYSGILPDLAGFVIDLDETVETVALKIAPAVKVETPV